MPCARILRTEGLTVRIVRTRIGSDADERGSHRMRVISKARLKLFWESPGHQDAEGPLRAWHTHVNGKTVCWHAGAM